MRILIYSDLQATVGHEMMHTDPGMHLQLWRVNKFYTDLFEIYKESKCDALWDLGDTTDDRSALPIPAIEAVCRGLSQFPKSNHNIKLMGNHEQYLRNTEIHVGRLFEPYFNVIGTLDEFTIEGNDIKAYSYPSDYESLENNIKLDLKDTLDNIVIGHFDVVGAGLTGSKSKGGVKPSALSEAKHVFLGHIHKPQTMHKNIHYVGSPFQQNYGESGESKSVIILDLKRGKSSFTRVPLEGFPVYRTVGFTEFTDLVSKRSEDRFKVLLKSEEETADFYRHPLSYLATEPLYDYEHKESGKTGEEEASLFSTEECMLAYLQEKPLSESNITIDEKEMLCIGHQLLEY